MSTEKQIPVWVPGISSVINGCLFAPLELASTRSKSKDAVVKSFRVLSHVYKNEGPLSLWKGAGWFIAGNGISRGIWLFYYEKLKNMDLGRTPDQSVLIAGFLSGATTAFFSNPVWTIKTYSQLPEYKGLFSIPPRTLMAGTIPAMGYVSIESMSQLFILEKLKAYYKDYIGEVSPIISGLIGGVSRLVVLPVSYPLHVITLRCRENAKFNQSAESWIHGKRHIWHVLKEIKKQKAWYDGILPYGCRVFPQAVTLFFIYELFRKMV